MNETTNKSPGLRIVHPPTTSSTNNPPQIVSVRLNHDEEVQWHWTHNTNGQSVVSGYEIVKKIKGRSP